jgi:Protein of unknown function (DUF3604)
MNIEYPDKFEFKVIKNEGVGGDFKFVKLTAPTIVKPGKPFELKIALTDINGLAILDYQKEITITLPDENFSAEVSFKSGEVAIAFIEDIQIQKEGYYRFQCEIDGKTFYSNPVYCTNEERSSIYWGDPHIHTVLSSCNSAFCRSICFAYVAAKNFSHLDWAGAADHVSNGRCELGRWKEQVSASNIYNEDGIFATLPAYEASLKGGCGGDNNVYLSSFPKMFIDECGVGDTKTLCQKLNELKKEEGFEFFIVPHHTTRFKKHGEISDEIFPGGKFMPLVEIYSKWGASEYRGNPIPLQKIHDGPSYVVDLLNQGLPLGFVGGSDTHSTLTFSTGQGIDPGNTSNTGGITAINTDTLTRDSIFDEMKNRNCYASSGERIFLDVDINGNRMGSFSGLESGSRSIKIKAAGENNIVSVDIIRNGETVKSYSPQDWHCEFSYDDTEDLSSKLLKSSHGEKFVYYYVRVTCESGARAWSSPVWFGGLKNDTSYL